MNPNRINVKKTTPRHIRVKLLTTKNTEKTLKVNKKKGNITYRGITVQNIADLSSETMDVSRCGNTSLKYGVGWGVAGGRDGYQNKNIL